MESLIQFLTQYGYIVLGGWVLAEQIGLPLPAAPILMAAGAMSAKGPFHFSLALVVTVFSCTLGDLFWFRVGQRGNHRVIQFLCRVSLEPDTCVRRTSSLIGKHGPKSLLVTKFIPGLNAMAAPLAGSGGVRLPVFLVFDLLGSILWCGTFLAVGYLFRERVTDIALGIGKFKGAIALSLLVVIPAGYIAFKSWQRRKFIREIWMERITPEELLQRIEARETMAIVDLRHPLDFLPDPRVLPDAIRISPDELEERYEEIPRDCEVILYCT
ncbi:MAG TPA: VTT domain-containing protein [Candidatus Saccharimonadales bacterium]|nr:VTT domain-containing protein [Candidatus Saccharimonadales bacterium]